MARVHRLRGVARSVALAALVAGLTGAPVLLAGTGAVAQTGGTPLVSAPLVSAPRDVTDPEAPPAIPDPTTLPPVISDPLEPPEPVPPLEGDFSGEPDIWPTPPPTPVEFEPLGPPYPQMIIDPPPLPGSASSSSGSSGSSVSSGGSSSAGEGTAGAGSPADVPAPDAAVPNSVPTSVPTAAAAVPDTADTDGADTASSSHDPAPQQSASGLVLLVVGGVLALIACAVLMLKRVPVGTLASPARDRLRAGWVDPAFVVVGLAGVALLVAGVIAG